MRSWITAFLVFGVMFSSSLKSMADTEIVGTYVMSFVDYPALPKGVLRVHPRDVQGNGVYRIKRRRGVYSFYSLDHSEKSGYSDSPIYIVTVDPIAAMKAMNTVSESDEGV